MSSKSAGEDVGLQLLGSRRNTILDAPARPDCQEPLVVAVSRRCRAAYLVAVALSSLAVGACETPREIEITWQNDTGRRVAYYPVRRGLDELPDIIGGIKRNVYEPGAEWRDDLDVGDGVAPWCPRGGVAYDFYFVEPQPGAPIVDGRIDNSQVTIADLEVVTIVAVDDTFCFTERTGNVYSVTTDP